jgi:hypothetical protein
MKKIHLLILMLLLIAGGINAQTPVQKRAVLFKYDDAGNRILRKDTTITVSEKSAQDTTSKSTEEIEEELAEQEKNFEFEKLGEANVKVYPNPVKTSLMVRFQNMNSTEGIQMQLYNTSGNLLQTQEPGSSYTELNMQAFSPGVYILRIIQNGEKLEYKIIKE